MAECKHPDKRLYTWIVEDPVEGTLLCCGCCDCGHSWIIVMKIYSSKGG